MIKLYGTPVVPLKFFSFELESFWLATEYTLLTLLQDQDSSGALTQNLELLTDCCHIAKSEITISGSTSTSTHV